MFQHWAAGTEPSVKLPVPNNIPANQGKVAKPTKDKALVKLISRLAKSLNK